MAKKTSAKSKGYRKYKEKKGLTPAQWKKVWIGVAVVLAIIVLVAVLYDDGSLEVKDGSVVVSGVNPLVVNVKETGTGKYYKLGEVPGIVEGYVAGETTVIKDRNEPLYFFDADPDGDAVLTDYTVSARLGKWKEMPETTYTLVRDYFQECDTTEPVYTQIGGRDVSYYTYTYALTGIAEDPDRTGYSQNLAAYVASCRDDCYVMISMANYIETKEEALDEAVLADLLEKVIATITFEK